MNPAREPFAQNFETLNLIKQTNLSDEKLFYKDKEGNIFPYLKTEICNKINVFKPCTFFPIFQELDIPFLEREWLRRIEYNIRQGVSEENLAYATFGQYLAWCKLNDIKGNTFKDSNKFFDDWYDYQNFHYIYSPPRWKFSYEDENLITQEERDKISNYFNKQEGQNYLCSNQTVVCGFCSDFSTWIKFRDSFSKFRIKRQTEILLESGERWVYISPTPACRGFRFYKLILDAKLDKEFVRRIILPMCAFYCKSLKWIQGGEYYDTEDNDHMGAEKD